MAMADSVWRGFRPFVRWPAICTQMAFYLLLAPMERRYGRCCMYGPNYVNLRIGQSLCCAVVWCLVCLLCTIHYAALPPGPIRPPLAPRPCHHRLHSPRPRPRRPGTSTPSARDPNLGSGNHDMSRLPTSSYLNDARDVYSESGAQYKSGCGC
jgi:hypothetical protein